MWKVGQKQPFLFQMSAILKFDFQKRKQLRFSEVNYLNYKKRPSFACDNCIFPKTRGNKNKQCTHSTALKNLNLCISYIKKIMNVSSFMQCNK